MIRILSSGSIDEAHFISATGEPKAGEKLVFRTAYGKLRKDRKLTRSCSLSRQSSHISVQGVKVVTN